MRSTDAREDVLREGLVASVLNHKKTPLDVLHVEQKILDGLFFKPKVCEVFSYFNALHLS